MAIEVLTSEPASFRAGDTVKFLKSFADHPASDGWELTYVFAFRGTAITVKAVADEDDEDAFLITLPKATSAKFAAGQWAFAAYAEKDGERATVADGAVQVLANLADVTKSHARKMVENLRALIEGRTAPNKDIESSNINGQEITKMGSADVRAWLIFYESKLGMEDEGSRRGGGKVQMIFN